MHNLILCGLPGVGKSSTATALALKLGWCSIDTDELLAERYKSFAAPLSCRQIYGTIGEKAFRALEHEVLHSLLNRSACIISIGGGTLLNEKNGALAKKLGKIIYLKNDIDIIYERLIKKGLPLYLDPENPRLSFTDLAAKREAIYLSLADCVIDTKNLTTDDIVNAIIARLFP